jgi:hypothetical protein
MKKHGQSQIPYTESMFMKDAELGNMRLASLEVQQSSALK